jgi:hypothetical protein
LLGAHSRILTIARPSVTQDDAGGNVYGETSKIIAQGLEAVLLAPKGVIVQQLAKREITVTGMFALDEDPCHRSLGRAIPGDTITDDRRTSYIIEAVEDVADQGQLFYLYVRSTS